MYSSELQQRRLDLQAQFKAQQEARATEGKTQCKQGGILNPDQLRQIAIERNDTYKAAAIAKARVVHKEMLKKGTFKGDFDQFLNHQRACGAITLRAIHAIDQSKGMAQTIARHRMEDRDALAQRRAESGPSRYRCKSTQSE